MDGAYAVLGTPVNLNWPTFIVAMLIGNLVITGFAAFDGNVDTVPLVGYVFAGIVSVLIMIVGDDWFYEK